MALDHDRWIRVLTEQTDLLCGVVRSADPAAPVPGCPGRTIGTLARSLTESQRRAADAVTGRAAGPQEDGPQEEQPVPAGGASAAELEARLADAGARLADALREAGPDAPVPASAGAGTAAAVARRAAHEAAVHRADAAVAAGLPHALDPQVAVDALDRWLELGTQPQVLERSPALRALLGPGRSVHLHATDTPAELDAEWVVDLGGAVPSWRRAHEKSAVAVRGPVVELLRCVYGRRPAGGEDLQVFGDHELLAAWLAAGRVD